MHPRRRHAIAAALYVGAGLTSLGLGATYLLRESFMSYHAAALGRSWVELDPATRTLIKALMEVAGGGWLALGMLVLLLVAIPVRRGERWARAGVPAAILVFYVPTLLATLSVAQRTPASPPWRFNVVACLCALVGVLLDTPWRATAGRDRGTPH
jgi:hypothetical protein